MNDNSEPQAPPPQPPPGDPVVIKLLQNLLAMAERGQIIGFTAIATDPFGKMVQIGQCPDVHLTLHVTGLEIIIAKLVSKLIQMEQQGQVSPIIRPPRAFS